MGNRKKKKDGEEEEEGDDGGGEGRNMYKKKPGKKWTLNKEKKGCQFSAACTCERGDARCVRQQN